VRAALEGIGFMMIAGHRVDQTLIDRVSERPWTSSTGRSRRNSPV
jgi:hypothetical protein